MLSINLYQGVKYQDWIVCRCIHGLSWFRFWEKMKFEFIDFNLFGLFWILDFFFYKTQSNQTNDEWIGLIWIMRYLINKYFKKI